MKEMRRVTSSAAQIPVIDITSLRDRSDSKNVASLLHAASREVGFIYITGHGIPLESIKIARDIALDFFRHPAQDKAIVSISKRHRGWLGSDSAVMEDGAQPDLKESFIWGYEETGRKGPEDHPLRGKNLWPPFLPEMRTHAMNYFTHAQEVACHLMRGFALGLDLPEDFFLRSISKPLSRASFVYYPAQPKESTANRFGVGPHTDFGVLTVLSQDDVGGLELQDLDGKWVKAPPMDGSLVVNVGDLLSRWTDGIYRSTPHRVINSKSRERLSLVFAFDPEPDTMIDARAVFGAEYEPLKPPILCGDYLTWRFKKAFPYRRT